MYPQAKCVWNAPPKTFQNNGQECGSHYRPEYLTTLSSLPRDGAA